MKHYSNYVWEKMNEAGISTLPLNIDYYLKYLTETFYPRSFVSENKLKTLKRNVSIANEVLNSRSTLEEVGKSYGLSKERIRQIAMKHLRIYRRFYKNYVEVDI